MRTLYINVNGVDIQSSEDVCVVGKPEDAIVNKFYYELGKEILKGVDVSVTRDINKKGIITAFMARNKESYDAIWKEWEKVKDKLLGENPTGPHKVMLPSEYISWLNNNSQTAYSEIAKSLHAKGGVVEISIDKIYRNAIGIIVNGIEPNKFKDCKQFVVYDREVTDDSAISLAVMEKLEGIVFKPYEDVICQKCGKSPCGCLNTRNKKYDVYFQSMNVDTLTTAEISEIKRMLSALSSLSLKEITNILNNRPTILRKSVTEKEAELLKKEFNSIGIEVKLVEVQ